MISLFRRSLDSWIVRGFFVLMTVAFVGWGISGSLTQLGGSPSWVAKVGAETIQLPAFQTEYQRALAQQQHNLPAGQEASPDLRQTVGQQTLQRMIAQAALAVELKKLGIVTPNDAVAAAARAMPAFRGPDGAFSKSTFDTVLRSNGFTEARFLAELRADIAQRQLLSAVTGSASAPDAEVRPLYDSEFEKRSADMATFPLSTAPEPPTPDKAALQRWYDNHPDSYATPEFRRIKAIELSPQSLAPEITIKDDELRAAYQEHKAEFETPAKRSAEVISTPDETQAKALAARWHDTPDWTAMQAAARADGAAAIMQDDATEVQFPDPDLAKAVFSATADSVSEPVKGALGWFVVKVTKVDPGMETTFDQAKESLRARLLAGKAADLMYDRANKIDQLLGNGTSLDALPGDLGLAGVAGTLDAAGETQAGTPAPIPGSAELKAALIAAAFQAHQGDPPQLTEVQTPSTGGSAYYALAVENVIPPGKKAFDAVKDQVTDDWKQDQRRRTQDHAATTMMIAVKGGQSFSDAATVAGVTPRLSPLVTRNQGNSDMPPELQRVLFGLKKAETTMVETSDGFVVAQLAEVVTPDAAADKTGYDQARAAITQSVQNDLATVFVDAVQQQTNPQTNRTAFNSVVQAQ
ncbi:SurA N-terminal domain-containing protein [Rhodopila sp.]|uniref:peptidylprolyl isomerase n=1 Tax=Rhodopila sp. TaxID=2480087 RepID=UPI003D0CEEEF